MAHVINTASTGFNLIARIRGFFEDTTQAWALNAEYKRTFAELDRLENRELNQCRILKRCALQLFCFYQRAYYLNMYVLWYSTLIGHQGTVETVS